jgi:CHASE3 domain sensor protein
MNNRRNELIEEIIELFIFVLILGIITMLISYNNILENNCKYNLDIDHDKFLQNLNDKLLIKGKEST